jgi:hypothetical protein
VKGRLPSIQHFSISVQNDVEHVTPDGASHRLDFDEGPIGPLHLGDLITQRLETLDVQPMTLTLVFEDGARLRIFTEEGPYECGQIYPPGKRAKLIVF